MNNNTSVDALLLPNGEYVVANEEKVWRYRASSMGLSPITESLSEVISPERLRQLFAGVIASAWQSARSNQVVNGQAMSLQDYIYRHLAGSYQTTHATPPMMFTVAEYYRISGRENLALYCEQIVREESGHDALALRDLRALGIDAEAFVEAVQPANSVAIKNYGFQLAHSDQPIAVLGYAYALERLALFQTREYVKDIESMIPKGVKATRCLRVHSAAGTDVRHVDESLKFIAELPPEERRLIALALYETILLMHTESDYPGDKVLDELINHYSIRLSA